MEPINEIEPLPLRLEGEVRTILGVDHATIELRFPADEGLPVLRCDLPGPSASAVSLMLRVHSRAGIPLAWATADLGRGDRYFETPPVTLLAMEGYAYLKEHLRRRVERRVLARRAYATATLA